jgi:hypothetical protein
MRSKWYLVLKTQRQIPAPMSTWVSSWRSVNQAKHSRFPQRCIVVPPSCSISFRFRYLYLMVSVACSTTCAVSRCTKCRSMLWYVAQCYRAHTAHTRIEAHSGEREKSNAERSFTSLNRICCPTPTIFVLVNTLRPLAAPCCNATKLSSPKAGFSHRSQFVWLVT